MRNIVIIAVACGCGAQDHDCREGPQALHALDAFPAAREWHTILEPAAAEKHPLPAVRAVCSDVAKQVERVMADKAFPLVIGGDHSCAVGTWSGVYHAIRKKGPLGLIWIDAHMDSHTFATTPSRALHGMPLACLLGHGAPELTRIAAPESKLRPEHVCLIGVRSYEAGEARLLHDLGVRVFDMAEIRQRGLHAVFDEAIAIVERGTAGFGISLDLDVLDPEEEPGVGSPAPGGLKRAELEREFHSLRGLPDFLAMEIVEYNPRRDKGHATAQAAARLFSAIAPA
jgi:arginase